MDLETYRATYHWMPANGPIKLGDSTLIHGIVFIEDPQLPAIGTPEEVIEQLRAGDPFLICDLQRKN